jgi:hypothetical protein
MIASDVSQASTPKLSSRYENWHPSLVLTVFFSKPFSEFLLLFDGKKVDNDRKEYGEEQEGYEWSRK